ncbi:MAG: hypothetical protein L0Y58_05460 [Verrucomicrobia subdivision 3 bacterium]|nr:hypothetical protein [Limisphaerales bacterium]
MTLIIATLIAALALVVALRYAQRTIKQAINDYTDPAPAQLEKGDTSPARLKAVQEKIAAFNEAIQTQKTSQELVLTADEINTLFAAEPSLQTWADRLFLFIEGDQLKARISWPLEDIGPFKLKGRYLNGVANLKLSIEKGRLHAHMESVTAKDKPVPPQILEFLRTIDIGEIIQQNLQSTVALNEVQSIEIKDGNAIIRSKPPPQ